MIEDVTEADLKVPGLPSLATLGIPVTTACVHAWASLISDETHEARSPLCLLLTSNQLLDKKEVMLNHPAPAGMTEGRSTASCPTEL